VASKIVFSVIRGIVFPMVVLILGFQIFWGHNL
jgi:K+-transporting ATPase c subunit